MARLKAGQDINSGYELVSIESCPKFDRWCSADCRPLQKLDADGHDVDKTVKDWKSIALTRGQLCLGADRARELGLS